MKTLLIGSDGHSFSNVGRFCEAAKFFANAPIATGVQRVASRLTRLTSSDSGIQPYKAE